MKPLSLALVVSILLGGGAAAGAQPAAGSIGGSVQSGTGIGLPGASVTARASDGTVRTVTSGPDGEYTITDLPPGGTYTVTAELGGFSTATEPRVVVAAGARTMVNFLLLPSAAETLAVTGRSGGPRQPPTTLETTISERLAHALPLIGRDYLSLASLAPGVNGNPSAPSTNGQTYWTNNVIVDGASHYSKWRSAARTFYSGYPLEAVQDVQVLTSQFAPEFGEGLSTVTSARTRSGGSVLRGSVLVFGQAGVLNDQPAFASRKPPASSLRAGATLGGPVRPDRTFFFGSYEGRRTRGNNIVSSPLAPRAAVRNDEDEHLAMVKLDHRLSANDVLTARYNGQWFTWVNENGGLWLPGSGLKYRNDVHTAIVSLTQLISERALNQARVQFARYSDLRTDLSPALYVLRAGHSIQGATFGPYGFGATPEDTWEGSDTLTLNGGPHVVKVGTGLRFTRAHNESLPWGRGAYYFAGPPELFPEPYAFVQNLQLSPSGHVVEPRSLSSFAFAQDEWRVSPRVTLVVGVRYDIEQIRNVEGYSAAADRNNLQPRAGATWAPFGRLTLRGGAGVYNQQHLLYYVNRAQLEGPTGSALVTLTPASPFMPSYPDVLSPEVLARIPRDLFVVSDTFRNPYAVQASFGAQHPIFGFGVAADYVYLAGHDLMSIVDANAPASVARPAVRSSADADATRPLTPVPGGYRKIITLGNEGRSWYHALQVKADRSFGGFQSLFTYTLARARDMANYQLPEDSRNLAAEKGRADNDVRHNVTAGLVWELPFTRAILSGWTLAAAAQFRSNRPFNITWGDDRNGTTQNDARPGGRNTGIGPTYRNIDVSLTRRVPLGPRTLELRAEAFNVLGTTNYDEYVGALSAPRFGQPVSALPRRRLQFAAIVRF
jgi:hypothetical protein